MTINRDLADLVPTLKESGGNIGVGVTSPANKLDVAGDSSASARMQLARYSADAGGSNMFLFKSRNATIGSQTVVQSGDALGTINWSGSDGTDAEVAASISAAVDATPGNNDMPGRLVFSTTADGSGTPTERMRIDSTGAILGGLTTSTGTANKMRFQSKGGAGGTAPFAGYSIISGNDEAALNLILNSSSDNSVNISVDPDNLRASSYLMFSVDATERARILSDGKVLVGKTTDSVATAGVRLHTSGSTFTCAADAALYVNRQDNDGVLVYFRQADTDEGSISVSGNTVSYNAFVGGHWTQLQQGRGYNPEILRGTVMSSIGEMSEWKSVTWTETIEHPAISAVEAKEAVLDEEGNVVEPAVEAVEGKDAWTESIPHREAYLGNLPVGATFEEDGFTKTVVDDGNERLPKVKISDVVGDKAVYGVFQTYDDVQDMLISSLGAFVVRIAAGVTVQIGDLLESNGDGCAKVQDDDVIRSKTIGKVTSTVATATYADGSYTVPCVLYCG